MRLSICSGTIRRKRDRTRRPRDDLFEDAAINILLPSSSPPTAEATTMRRLSVLTVAPAERWSPTVVRSKRPPPKLPADTDNRYAPSQDCGRHVQPVTNGSCRRRQHPPPPTPLVIDYVQLLVRKLSARGFGRACRSRAISTGRLKGVQSYFFGLNVSEHTSAIRRQCYRRGSVRRLKTWSGDRGRIGAGHHWTARPHAARGRP
jgi:hypothetical protein